MNRQMNRPTKDWALGGFCRPQARKDSKRKEHYHGDPKSLPEFQVGGGGDSCRRCSMHRTSIGEESCEKQRQIKRRPPCKRVPITIGIKGTRYCQKQRATEHRRVFSLGPSLRAEQFGPRRRSPTQLKGTGTIPNSEFSKNHAQEQRTAFQQRFVGALTRIIRPQPVEHHTRALG